LENGSGFGTAFFFGIVMTICTRYVGASAFNHKAAGAATPVPVSASSVPSTSSPIAPHQGHHHNGALDALLALDAQAQRRRLMLALGIMHEVQCGLITTATGCEVHNSHSCTCVCLCVVGLAGRSCDGDAAAQGG